MYCPTCGSLATEGLKYCKSCGERLTRETEDKDGTPGKMLDDILETLFWFAMLGLGILVGLVAVLLGKDVQPELVGIIVVAYLAVIFGVCFMLARQVPKLIDARLKAWSNTNENTAPQQLTPPTAGQIDEYREPAMSVTDRTTKTLDKVPLRKS